METLYASHYFPREPKVQYRPASALSSPSAKSSSSADSQDDLLPELWLESAPMENYSFSRPAVGMATQQNSLFRPNYSMDASPNFAYDAPESFHGSLLLRDESLEYAQSLLPNSLLFPVTGHRIGQERPVSGRGVPQKVECRKSDPGISTSRPGHSRRSSSTSSSKSRNGSASSIGSAKTQSRNVNTQLYKTELCASFMKSGVCPYGGKCQFAHGQHELKSVERPSNWRSKPCANWARNGSCRYGSRCCFKHGEE